MCFHNSASVKAQELEQRYNAKYEGEDFVAVYHGSGFSFPKLPVITTEEPHSIKLYNWGLIPKWSTSLEGAKQQRINTLNARSETVFEKPSFKHLIGSKRCLVPSTGFFEWRDYNKKKYPYFITLKNECIFSMAGIYEHWVDKSTGEVFNTFSVLTCDANPLMAKIHNSKMRMPVILPKEDENTWIRERLTNQEIVDLMKPLDENHMQAHTISKLITSRDAPSNVEDVQKEFTYQELPHYSIAESKNVLDL
jgi:putative SOS response-associated peptidase YedK